MVKAYSYSTHCNVKLSDNFSVGEFVCKDYSDKIIIDTELVELLQKIRNHFGKSISITSAYRNTAYNKQIGGASNSQHIYGTAADIVIDGVAPLTIAQYAEYLLGSKGGIGVYSGFTHVDVRAARSRWDNRSGKEVVVSGWFGYVENTKGDELTMAQYEELKKMIAELSAKVDKLASPMIYNYVDKNMPEWARPTIQKLVDKGYLKGNENEEFNLDDTLLRVLVINDRAGCFDK